LYESLQQEAFDLDVLVEERYLQPRLKGLYGDNVIWINKRIQSPVEKACILAEELGHHHTTAGDILNQTTIANVKQEKLARRWAWEKLVTPEKLIEAYKEGCRTRFEIAEMLHVTEIFLEESLQFYREKYGTEIQVDQRYTLYLEPLAVYENFK